MARKQETTTDIPCCSPADACSARPPLHERPLLGFVDAVKVMALFKVMATTPAFAYCITSSGAVRRPLPTSRGPSA